eukprot:1734348-Rhodomonas_salina.1
MRKKLHQKVTKKQGIEETWNTVQQKQQEDIVKKFESRQVFTENGLSECLTKRIGEISKAVKKMLSSVEDNLRGASIRLNDMKEGVPSLGDDKEALQGRLMQLEDLKTMLQCRKTRVRDAQGLLTERMAKYDEIKADEEETKTNKDSTASLQHQMQNVTQLLEEITKFEVELQLKIDPDKDAREEQTRAAAETEEAEKKKQEAAVERARATDAAKAKKNAQKAKHARDVKEILDKCEKAVWDIMNSVKIDCASSMDIIDREENLINTWSKMIMRTGPSTLQDRIRLL